METTLKKIKLTQEKTATVDNIDFEELSKFKWYLNSYGYAERTTRKGEGKRRNVRMHQQVALRMGLNIIGNIFDHINRDKLDNRRKNLRIVSKQINSVNRDLQSNNKSGYRGVSFYKRDKNWESYIKYNQKRIFLGRYKTKQEAALKYNIKAKELFGNYAYLNTI